MALVGSPSDHQLPITFEVINPKGEKQGDAREYKTEYREREPLKLEVLKNFALSKEYLYELRNNTKIRKNCGYILLREIISGKEEQE